MTTPMKITTPAITITLKVFPLAISEPLLLGRQARGRDPFQNFLPIVQGFLKIPRLLLFMRVAVVARVGLLCWVTFPQFYRDLGRDGPEAVAAFVSSCGALTSRSHVATYAIGVLGCSGNGSMAP